MNARRGGLAGAAAALLLAGGLVAQQAAAVATPPRFETILWLHGGPARDERFWAAVRALGFTAVSVTNGEDPAEPGRHGLRFYRDQCAGKGELEIREAEWRAWFDRYLAERDDALLARPSCLADPESLRRVLAKTTSAVQAALPHGPVMASLADEASATSHFNPLDGCATGTFRAAFRAELEQQFAGDVHALNRRWGTDYVDFAKVEPWSTAAMRTRALVDGGLPRNLAPWSDQLAFTDRLFCDLVDAALSLAKELAPDLPVGLTGMQPPAAFGGHDYQRLMRLQSAWEVYDIGGARALAAARAPRGAREFVTLFPSRGEGAPELVRGQIAAAFAHGIDGVIVWSAGDVLQDDASPSPFGLALRDAFTELRGVADAFAGARLEPSSVWIVESQASVRAQWFLDAIDDGETWPRRLSSHEARHGTSLRARESWLALLRDLGLQPDFVYAGELPARLAATPPRLLVLSDTLALADVEVRAITTYVEAGGNVVADHGTGVYDEALRLRERGGLDALFGIRTRSLSRDDWLVRDARGRDGRRSAGGVAVAEAGLRGTLGEPLEFADVQLEARRGQGRTTYLNLAVCEYADARLDESRFALARELRSRVRQVVTAAGLSAPVLVRGDGLPACVERIPMRARDGRRLLAIRLAALERPELLARLAADGGPLVELGFPSPVRLVDLRAGRTLEPADHLRVRLPPFEGLFFAIDGER